MIFEARISGGFYIENLDGKKNGPKFCLGDMSEILLFKRYFKRNIKKEKETILFAVFHVQIYLVQKNE